MRQHQVGLHEALELLVGELSVYEQVQRWEEEEQDREVASWAFERSC